MAEEEESSASGDSTDAFSENFDSLKALYAEKPRIPVPEAPLFDNISKFESAVLKSVDVKPSTSKEPSGKKKEETSSGRKFLPHQAPIKGKSNERQQRYREKNVVGRMRKALGPLAMLYQYMENRTRVKIYTRNASGTRGYIEAYVAAFDKHWNLALEDCLEIWSRKIKRKAPALGDPTVPKNPDADTGIKVIVKERSKNWETLERHIPQLLVRGEQVVLIIKLD